MSDDKTLSVNISSNSGAWATFASKENQTLSIRPLLVIQYKDKPPVIPAADFSFQKNNLEVDFRDASVDADGTVESYNWAFGDNTNSTLTNPSHTFAKAGTYTVSLTVTDNDGAINTKTLDITVSANEASTISIPVVADAYVQSGTFGENNYGTTDDLYVKLGGGSYTREALLKFDLSAVKNKVISANLRLNVAAGGASVKWPVKAIDDDNWLESTVTWNNKPASGVVLDTQAGSTDTFIEWDITEQVIAELAGDKTISLNLSAIDGSVFARFSSKDKANSELPPVIVVVFSNSIVSDAGDDISAEVGSPITLNGSVDGGTASSFNWTFSSVPEGSSRTNADIIYADTQSAAFIADVSGPYELTFVASDGEQVSADSLTVTVEQPVNTLLCDADGNGLVERGDIIAIFMQRNQPAQNDNDPMDVDQDGFITVSDLRACQARL
jgi:PKD repeat protein